MSRIVAITLAACLIMIAIFVFVYPHKMIAPGKLIPAHQQLDNDCFACHTPLRGTDAERCMACHKPADIGRLTTAGKTITKSEPAIPFHQKLTMQDCLSCHTDHAGVQRLQPAGRFDHALLRMDVRDQCAGCHQSPADALHQKISGNCRQCHAQDKWTPATFNHAKYFVLDRDHNAPCATCHVRNDYQRYTCYGCHEHTPNNIRSEHSEEGISNFDNCVECHRSADEHEIRGGQNRDQRTHDD